MPAIKRTKTDRSKRLQPRARTAAAGFLIAATLGASAIALPQGAGAVPPGGAVSKSNGASVTINRTKLKAGENIKVTGKNWKSKGSRTQRGAKVTIKLDDSTILAVLPIKKKKFSGYVVIPTQVKAGNHWLRFLAAAPSTSVKSKTFTVTK